MCLTCLSRKSRSQTVHPHRQTRKRADQSTAAIRHWHARACMSVGVLHLTHSSQRPHVSVRSPGCTRPVSRQSLRACCRNSLVDSVQTSCAPSGRDRKVSRMSGMSAPAMLMCLVCGAPSVRVETWSPVHVSTSKASRNAASPRRTHLRQLCLRQATRGQLVNVP